jgi:hypothetical protein
MSVFRFSNLLPRFFDWLKLAPDFTRHASRLDDVLLRELRIALGHADALLIPLSLGAKSPVVGARAATITINPREVTVLYLRPEFESTIHMPEEVTSVILWSPGEFKAEHNEGEPEFVYVKPITKEAAQSNLLIATKSGQHVTLEPVSDGDGTTDESTFRCTSLCWNALQTRFHGAISFTART